MSSIDYRQIIDETLPRLAREIAEKGVRGIGEGIDWRTTSQSSWRSQADFSRPFHREVEKSGQGYEYIFKPMRRADAPNYGHTGPVADECQIKFRNLRVTDVLDRQYGEIDQSPAGTPVVSTIEYPNDTPHVISQNLESGTREWTEWGSNWAVAIESELEQTIKAGSELYGVESETRVKLAASAETGGVQSGGKEETEKSGTAVPISPRSVLVVTTTRQPVLISQDIVVTGTLDFEVDIVLMDCYGERCANYEALLNVFRGLGAQNDRIRSWFSDPSHAIPESVLESIQRPTVTINIGLQGVPGESHKLAHQEKPLSEG